MKTKLILVLFLFTTSIYAQDFVKGTIITQRYDTISNVKIEKMNEGKSLLHVTYIDENGNEQKPSINDIKCYTRGEDCFVRIFHNGEMVMVKRLVEGSKVNLYKRHVNGGNTYFIEKVYDELIKVPTMGSKFRKTMSKFLSANADIANKIKAKELTDINEIVSLYNKKSESL